MASLARADSGQALAFESIDGPPPPVFERLVSALNDEAPGKPIVLVSRDAPATYHVRAYLSAQVRRGRAVIAWVFDVYDPNEQRALRLSGEETAGKARHDAWTAADDALLRRIAEHGLNGLAAFLSGTGGGPAPEVPQAPSHGPVVASADDATPGTGRAGGHGVLGFSAH